jgi:hypothetical protein
MGPVFCPHLIAVDEGARPTEESDWACPVVVCPCPVVVCPHFIVVVVSRPAGFTVLDRSVGVFGAHG